MVNKGKGCITSIFDGSIPIGVIKHGLETIFTKPSQPIEPPVEPSEVEYVKDGLVANFSGKDTYANGVWLDRISGYKFTPVSTNTRPQYKASERLYSAETYGGMIADFKLSGAEPYTFEVVTRDIKNAQSESLSLYYATIVGSDMVEWNNNDGGVFLAKLHNTYNQDITFGLADINQYSVKQSELVDNSMDTFTVVPSVGVYHNGVKMGDCSTYEGENGVGLFIHSSGSKVNSYRGLGKIHAVRVYNRYLTEEEIQYNYEQDIKIYDTTQEFITADGQQFITKDGEIFNVREV